MCVCVCVCVCVYVCECERWLHLALPVDSNDSTGSVVDSGDKDGLSTDTVHVDAGPRLKVVEMDVAKLSNEVDHVVLGAHLDREERERVSE